MMKPVISILIPHYNTPSGRRAVSLCVNKLLENTRTQNVDIVLHSARGNNFQIWNELARFARSDVLAFWCFDQYPAPGWDIAALTAYAPDTLVTIPNCESGFSPSHEANAVANFGMTPEQFDDRAFKEWAINTVRSDILSWQLPWLISRQAFLDLGGFPQFEFRSTEWEMTDKVFFDHWMGVGGKTVRAHTWVYHLMRWAYTGEER